MATPPGGGGDVPQAGYYPDPSIPGYIRYWNGGAWVPGTSRPAPKEGEALPAPPVSVAPLLASSPAPAPAPVPVAAVEETGPVFLDADPEPASQEPSSAWQATTSGQTGFGGERDQRVSWGTPDTAGAPADPRSAAASAWPAADPREGGQGAGSGHGTGSARDADARTGDAGAAASTNRPAGGGQRQVDQGSGGSSAAAAWPAAGGQGEPEQGSGGAAGGARDGGRVARAASNSPAGSGNTGAPTAWPAAAGQAVPGQGPGGVADAGARGGGTSSTPAGPVAGGQVPAPDRSSGSAPAAAWPAAGDAAPVAAPARQANAGAPAPAWPAAGGAADTGREAGSASALPGQRPGGAGAAPAQDAPATGAPARLGGMPVTPSWAAQQAPSQAQAQQAQAQQAQPHAQAQPQAPAQQAHAHAPAVQQSAPQESQPVVPWKPVVEDPFLSVARAQASARPAGMGRRLAARLIDTVVLGAAVGAVSYPFVTAALQHIDDKIEAAKQSGLTVQVWLIDSTTSLQFGIALAALLVLGVLYEALPTAKWGRTLGKKVCGIEVRDIEAHEPPTFGAALRRWLVYSVLGLLVLGVLNVLWCLFDRPWRQCWHDKAARTFVAG
ncbi:RDD family protein [Streptomyces sp. NPDC085481]|uniref:RDD family protein n=1 Tax=Streptomyces sp. NPDC085481 TaxID=3365727 RepID=UPI0037CE6142